ncbi:hypothetical protein AKJ16_DCAP24205 [Drosera capensis]
MVMLENQKGCSFSISPTVYVDVFFSSANVCMVLDVSTSLPDSGFATSLTCFDDCIYEGRRVFSSREVIWRTILRPRESKSTCGSLLKRVIRLLGQRRGSRLSACNGVSIPMSSSEQPVASNVLLCNELFSYVISMLHRVTKQMPKVSVQIDHPPSHALAFVNTAEGRKL